MLIRSEAETLLFNSTRSRKLNGDTLARAIQESGKESGAVKKVSEDVIKELHDFYKDYCECVKFGYTADERPIFVVLLIGEEVERKPYFEGPLSTFDIRTRGTSYINSEAKVVNRVPLDMDKQKVSEAQRCITQNAEHLFENHSNLTSISVSPVRSKGYPNNWCWSRETCIVLHVTVKGVIPFSEIALPKSFGGLGIDVREDICIPLKGSEIAADKYHKRLRLGCMIGDGKAHGTIGGFVELKSGIIGCITASHLFLGESDSCKKTDEKKNIENTEVRRNFGENVSVYQPGRKADGCVGFVTNTVLCKRGKEKSKGVDAAFVRIVDPKRKPTAGFPRSEGKRELCDRFRYTNGRIVETCRDIREHFFYKEIFKFGCITGPTIIGRYHCKGAASVVVNPKHRIQLNSMIVVLENDIESAHELTDEGDSGSLVLVRDKPNGEPCALGIISAATKGGQVFISPIKRILKTFGCDVKRGLLPLQDNTSSEEEETTDELTSAKLTTIEKDIHSLKGHVSELKGSMAQLTGHVQKISSLRENFQDIESIKQTVAVIPAMNKQIDILINNVKTASNSCLKKGQQE